MGFVEITDFGQPGLLQNANAGLDLPDDLKLFTKRVLVDGGQPNQTLAA